jgi:5-methyltetrahydropteroyltriglutamate--homocysteine methyltransferase
MSTSIPRAEHVGSLLRPRYLLTARERYEAGDISVDELRGAEDRAIAELLATQQDAGVDVYTDGEARRESWRAGLLESLSGVIPAQRTMRWYRDGRELTKEETLSDGAIVNARVSRKQDLTGTEAAFMAVRAPGPYKITMISAAMAGMIWDPVQSAAAYPTVRDLMEHLAEIQIEEIGSLAENHGVRWVQLDSLTYTQAIDAGHSGSTRSRIDPRQALDAAIAIDSKIVRAVKSRHPAVTVGMHICRGNYRSSWMAQGSYEPVAERLLNEVPVDRFLLEYDTERAGGFEPLRFLPAGPTVVLGLVTTKTGQLEDQGELLRRVDEAARYAPLGQLALSPQCGFASGSLGNLISHEDQRRKLDLVVDTARKVWE